MKTKTKKTAYLLMSIIILLCIISSIFLLIIHKSDQAYVACIYVNGELYDRIPLYQVDSSYSFRILTEDGHYNEILVENSAIRILEADCPDKICVNQGPITNNLLPITCLPHNLVIELKPATPDTDKPDAITH